MTDFLTRVAQRAIGMAPAIQPVVGSRYAPARVPLAELPELETDPGLNTEASARNVEARASAFSTLPIRNVRPRTITKGNAEAQPASEAVSPLPAQPEPTRPTPFGREVQPAPAIVALARELHGDREIIDGPVFESPSPKGVDSPLISKGNEVLISNERQAVLPGEPLTEYSVSEEASLVDRGSESVASVEPPQVVSTSKRSESGAPSDKTTDRGSASTPIRQPARNQEKALQEEPVLQIDEVGILTVESEPRLLTELARNRREAHPRESFGESFAESSASSFPVLPDERAESSSPVIRVTIGRIDVRAVTPSSPPPQPSAPPAPKLSLDEFLRQHNGRRQ
jgi:hypothetical protein